jgi:hypothetical protein
MPNMMKSMLFSASCAAINLHHFFYCISLVRRIVLGVGMVDSVDGDINAGDAAADSTRVEAA